MRIVIINPNSDSAQTAQIDRAAKAFAADRFEVVTLATPGAPQYIDTCMDAAKALPGMLALVEQWEEKADAYVIACHCDPNLTVLREASAHPVLGIGESSMKMATMLGHKFSVVSTGERGIPNKEANIRAYGLEPFTASLRAPGPECRCADMAGKLRNAAAHAVNDDRAEVMCSAPPVSQSWLRPWRRSWASPCWTAWTVRSLWQRECAVPALPPAKNAAISDTHGQKPEESFLFRLCCSGSFTFCYPPNCAL